MGALSIYSDRPDGFDGEETKLLGGMAENLAHGITTLRIRAQQNQAETALRESEARLRLLGDNLPDSYVYQSTIAADNSPRFLYVSAGVEKVHGVKAEDVLRNASLVRDQIAPEFLPALGEAEALSLRYLSDFTMELRIRCTDGQCRWMRLCSRPRRLPSGQVVWDGVATDVTARKWAEDAGREAERRLTESERKYRELVELANSIILRWTSEGIDHLLQRVRAEVLRLLHRGNTWPPRDGHHRACDREAGPRPAKAHGTKSAPIPKPSSKTTTRTSAERGSRMDCVGQ